MNIRQMEVVDVTRGHTGRQTYMKKLIVTFRLECIPKLDQPLPVT